MADEIAIKRIYDLATLTESSSGYFIALDKNGNTDAVKLDLNAFISSLNHNTFGGKQGGVAGEYYHLSNAELTFLNTIPANYVPYSDANSNVDLGNFNLKATSIIKTGGTANQFLKADGSVDITVYLPSASYTANDVLTKVKSVDGVGSGLDADLLDGEHGSYYLNYNNLENKPTINNFWTAVTGGINYASGNVGVGVSLPTSKLDIAGEIGIRTTAGSFPNKIRSVDGIGEGGGALDDLLIESQGGIYIRSDYNDNGISGNISFGVYNTSLNNPFFIIKDTGKVGIGTDSPAEKLDVSGNIKASGVLYGKSDQVAALEKNSKLGVESGDTLNFVAKTDYSITASASAISFSLTGLTKTDQSFALYFTQSGTEARTLTITYAGKVFGGSGCKTGSGTDTITVAVSTTLSQRTKVVFHSEDSTNIWVSVDNF